MCLCNQLLRCVNCIATFFYLSSTFCVLCCSVVSLNIQYCHSLLSMNPVLTASPVVFFTLFFTNSNDNLLVALEGRNNINPSCCQNSD